MSEKTIPKPDFMTEEEWAPLVATRNPEIIRVGSGVHVKQYLETNGGGDNYILRVALPCSSEPPDASPERSTSLPPTSCRRATMYTSLAPLPAWTDTPTGR